MLKNYNRILSAGLGVALVGSMIPCTEAHASTYSDCQHIADLIVKAESTHSDIDAYNALTTYSTIEYSVKESYHQSTGFDLVQRWLDLSNATYTRLGFSPLSQASTNFLLSYYKLSVPININNLELLYNREKVEYEAFASRVTYAPLLKYICEGSYVDPRNDEAILSNLKGDEKLVAEAESGKTQQDIDFARQCISNSDRYGKFQSSVSAWNARLDAVQSYVNQYVNTATSAVVQAENDKSQSSVDSAWTKVNVLSSGTVKTDLSNRLNNVQNYLNLLNSAFSLVTTAESNKDQNSVNNAKNVVNQLQSGVVKTDLTNRLNNVQAYINQLNNAYSLVATAESTKTQTNINTATSAVNALPNSTSKTSLLTRLDSVQDALDLSNASTLVSTAENTKLRRDIDSARTATNKLDASSGKTNLLNRLTSLELTIATNAVVKAETSKVQTDIDLARAVIVYVSDATAKQSLNTRLDVVIASNYIATASKNPNKTTIADAQGKINLVSDTTKKAPLQAQLDTINAGLVSRVTALVASAEGVNIVDIATTSAGRTAVADAKAGVDLLLDGADKTSLSTRLVEVDKIVAYNDAKVMVDTLYSLSPDSVINSIQDRVNTLSNDPVRQKLLQDRIDVLRAIIASNIAKAETAVDALDITSAPEEIQHAQGLVKLIPKSSKQDELQKRIDDLSGNIQLYLVLTMVNTFDVSKGTLDDIAKIQSELSKLPDSATKSKI